MSGRKLIGLLLIVSILMLAFAVYSQQPSASAQEERLLEGQHITHEVIPVDIVFTAAFDAELQATIDALSPRTCVSFYGRTACLGRVPGLRHLRVLALVTGTQPMAAEEAIVRLRYHFPPRHGRYLLFTHGGIAGGLNIQWVEGAPDMQPGDSLAPAGTCGTNSNIFQPYRTHGYVEAQEGDTFESIAAEITGDPARGAELFEYNAERLGLSSPEELEPGMVLLTPTDWPENAITSFGIPYGGSTYSNGQHYRFRPEDPCIYLSAEALSLRDEVLSRMDVPPLSPEVISYRQSHFSDARTEPVVFSGDWNEGSGWSWYGDPWIGRHIQLMYHVAQGDMETFFVANSLFGDYPARIDADENGTLQRAEVDMLIYRTSSDPPDRYAGPAFDIDAFLVDPEGTYAAVRAAYGSAIPFPRLIADQSAQFREFNFTAAHIAAGN